MPHDATEEFLQKLPEIRPGENFWFACHPGVPCFNACCSKLTMPLWPYDVLRLRQGLNMGSEEFFEEFVIADCYPDTGFPSLHLRMREDDPEQSCPFLTAQGCGVYAHRSSACRTYPLGRAARPDGNAPGGVEERYFLVREAHCRGFEQQTAWTVESWLRDQGLEPYHRTNDRYMTLVSRYKDRSGGARLSGKQATMALLCLYQGDRFLEFLLSVGLLDRVLLQGDYAGEDAASLTDRFSVEPELLLNFGFDWLELALCGESSNLGKR